jgi:hypothetical protein
MMTSSLIHVSRDRPTNYRERKPGLKIRFNFWSVTFSDWSVLGPLFTSELHIDGADLSFHRTSIGDIAQANIFWGFEDILRRIVANGRPCPFEHRQNH